MHSPQQVGYAPQCKNYGTETNYRHNCRPSATPADGKTLMELDKIRTDLQTMVSEAVSGSGLGVEYESIFDGIPGFETDRNAEVIQIAEKLSGRESGTVAFGTEGPYLNAMGMDTVVLGPGDIDQAHQANEYLSLDRIPPMLDILTKMVDHFCIK